MIISSLTGLMNAAEWRGDPPRDEACEADLSFDWPFLSLDLEEPLALVMAARAGRLMFSMLGRRTSSELGLELFRSLKTSSKQGGSSFSLL